MHEIITWRRRATAYFEATGRVLADVWIDTHTGKEMFVVLRSTTIPRVIRTTA